MATYLLALGSLAQAGDEAAGRRLVDMDAMNALEGLSVSEDYRPVFDQAARRKSKRPSVSELGKPESEPEGAVWSPIWGRVRRVAAVLVPTTLVTSLFFYFGYVYATRLYANFGVSAAGMEFATTDYVIRSLNVLVEPFPFVAFVALALLIAHLLVTLVMKTFTTPRPGTASDRGGLTGRASTWRSGYGCSSLDWYSWWPSRHHDRIPTPAPSMSGPVGGSSGCSRCCTGCTSPSRVSAPTAPTARPPPSCDPTPPWAVLAVILGVRALPQRLRGLHGSTRTRAPMIKPSKTSGATSFALTQVFSTVDLGLDHLDVDHAFNDRGDNGFNHQYGEFRLFLHDNGRYLLWPVNRSPRDGLLMLFQSDDLRVESRPQLLTDEQRSAASCPAAQAQPPRT